MTKARSSGDNTPDSRASYPPVASNTISLGLKPARKAQISEMPAASFANLLLALSDPDKDRMQTSNQLFATSRPTNTESFRCLMDSPRARQGMNRITRSHRRSHIGGLPDSDDNRPYSRSGGLTWLLPDYLDVKMEVRATMASRPH